MTIAGPSLTTSAFRIINTAQLLNGVIAVASDQDVASAASDVKRDAAALGKSSIRLGRAAASAWRRGTSVQR